MKFISISSRTTTTPSGLVVVIFIITIFFISVSVSASVSASALATEQDTTPPPSDKRYIVKFKTNNNDNNGSGSGSNINFLHRDNTVQKQTQTQSITRTKPHYRLHKDDPRYIMTLPQRLIDTAEVMIIDTEEDLLFWKNHEDVEYVEADSKVYPHQSLPLSQTSYSSSSSSHSSSSSSSLSLFNIGNGNEDIPWGIQKAKALNVNDKNVYNRKVCIIDTGYDVNHPDLPSSVTGMSQVSSQQSWKTDGAGHGTHVAGTIAAIGGNNIGVVGVNRNGQIKIHIVKVFDNNGMWTWASDIIKAVESCVDAGSNVINMSLGGGTKLNAETEAYKKAFEVDGVLLVASAGNNGTSKKSYPASYPAVISVGAVGSTNRRASFSQYNDQVDICAPGVAVRSTIPGGRYRKLDGTSMSSPHVAGVAALVWSHFPNKNAAEIRQALESSARDLGTAGRDNEYGHGLVQADLAYNYLLSGGGGGGGGGGPNPAPVPAPTPKCIDSPLGWHDSDGSNYNCDWYAQQSRCSDYGNKYPNDGKTANEACCSCGGGTSSGSRPTAPVPAPVPAPVSPPTRFPVPPPTSAPVQTCIDSPLGWHDSDGSNYNCEWYSQQNRCSKFGNNFPNDGKTANEACCSCGGGTSSGSRPTAPVLSPVTPPIRDPTQSPVPPPTSAPVRAPVSAPTPASGKCIDSPLGWHDSDGPKFDCIWYGKQNRCSDYGNGFANDGKTANEACCTCGGGTISGPAPTPSSTVVCGCSSCTNDILNREIRSDLTVQTQITWLVENIDITEIEACVFICTDVFPEICGPECDPTACSN